MLDTGNPAARQYDKLEAENAIFAIQNCASVLYAIRFSSEELSDDARNGALDLVADTLEKRGEELQRFFDAVIKAEIPAVVMQYHARQPEAAVIDLAA